jgi:hypothetical protein
MHAVCATRAHAGANIIPCHLELIAQPCCLRFNGPRRSVACMPFAPTEPMLEQLFTALPAAGAAAVHNFS